MDGRKYYVLCGSNCKFESMTKEQILTAITQAVEGGNVADVDTGFITKIKEQNRGTALSFWIGTQAEYNALEEKAENCFYICTDDTTGEDLKTSIDELREDINNAVKYTDSKATFEVRLTREGGKTDLYGTGDKTVEEIKAAVASGRRVIARIYKADGTRFFSYIFEYNEPKDDNVKFALITETAKMYITYKEDKTFEMSYDEIEDVAQLQKDMKNVQAYVKVKAEEIVVLQNDMQTVKTQLEDVAQLQKDMENVQAYVKVKAEEIVVLQNDMQTVKIQIEGIVSQLTYLTEIVSTLEQKIN